MPCRNRIALTPNRKCKFVEVTSFLADSEDQVQPFPMVVDV